MTEPRPLTARKYLEKCCRRALCILWWILAFSVGGFVLGAIAVIGVVVLSFRVEASRCHCGAVPRVVVTGSNHVAMPAPVAHESEWDKTVRENAAMLTKARLEQEYGK